MSCNFRIGNGFDVHRLVPDRKLTICGVTIEHTHGLLGHSDADVAIHALCDALLGAAALGDIGAHFPDSDPRYRGIDSRLLLRHVVHLLADKGYRVVKVDITIMAQEPKMAPHITEMRANLSADLSLATETSSTFPLDCVSVKATTTEKLGFTGRGEGIAAQATALIVKA